ncbi:LysM peptidoglycan-binding domain-containing protein [Paenibacillus alkalitolerans]|uniref:LysM peptidoglycan-binding domain-containing protein n=1 Tax=Paenibacillus alkalitolerans TaxID=2799335 RepID=UPI0018F76E79|nr:LysM domain-containing protein [Paenibacillus alkalitolerans]
MNRQFFGSPFGFGGFGGFGGFPFGGFGGFSPFFFGGRRFFPSFFLSPFTFPFFRGEDDRNSMYYAQHQVREGETMDVLAATYNVPRPILEAMNTHIQNPHLLAPGTVVYIPRLDRMYCKMMLMEQESSHMGMAYPAEQTMTYPGVPNSMYPGHVMPAQMKSGTKINPVTSYVVHPNVISPF